MLNSEKKVTIELLSEAMGKKSIKAPNMTNPFMKRASNEETLALMIKKILHEELPQLENNSLLYDLVLYSLVEKMNTVQTVGNVLSYIKENNVKEIHDVSIANGEVRIKCSV